MDRAIPGQIEPVVRLRNFIQEHINGGCKIISEGSGCICPLCDLDRLIETLQWYGEHAEALSRYGTAKNDNAMLAVVTELMLDAGKRAHGA